MDRTHIGETFEVLQNSIMRNYASFLLNKILSYGLHVNYLLIFQFLIFLIFHSQ